MENDEEFSLKEWDVRARIGRQNTSSRRFSASHVRSLREEARSFRSNFTISSTASSPGYPFRDEIDPSTYSFTSALKALQAKQGCVWDSPSPEGLSLNSKWSDAEKYICNPLSGEVPMECLSTKTLSQRSFGNIAMSRITMSAPLVYPSQHPRRVNVQGKPPSAAPNHNSAQVPIQEKKEAGATKDVGIQSTPSDLVVGSSSPSPTSTPSISERTTKRYVLEAEDSPKSNSKVISEEEVEENGTGDDDDDDERLPEIKDENVEGKDGDRGRDGMDGRVWKCRQGGCLAWMVVMRRRQREKHRPRRKHRLFLPRINGC